MQYPRGYALPMSHIISIRESYPQYPWGYAVPVSHILSTRESYPQYPWGYAVPVSYTVQLWTRFRNKVSQACHKIPEWFRVISRCWWDHFRMLIWLHLGPLTISVSFYKDPTHIPEKFPSYPIVFENWSIHDPELILLTGLKMFKTLSAKYVLPELIVSERNVYFIQKSRFLPSAL